MIKGKLVNRKTIFIIVVLLFIFGLAIIYLKVGRGLVPHLPIGENIAEKIVKTQNLGTPVKFPLKISGTFKLRVFAKDLPAGARVLRFDKNQNLLVSIPKDGKIIVLPDKNKDGEADEQIVLLKNLNSPHGIDFYENYLYVAETHQVVRYKYDSDNFTAVNPDKILDIDNSGGHSSRTIRFSPDEKLYITAGSSCNVCEEESDQRGAMMRVNPDGSDYKLFATGLRNTVFFDFDEDSQIWGNDMGRDLLGDLLPPDELNIITEDKNYGWPFCYGNNIVDPFGKSEEKCQTTVGTTWDYPAHVAPLGISFIKSSQFPDSWQGDLLVSQHGSWNSSIPVGYKIIRLVIENGRVLEEKEFISGFLQGSVASGRPVDLLFGSDGSLYISDDKANAIYKVSQKSS